MASFSNWAIRPRTTIGEVVTAKIILDNSTFHTFLFNWPVGSHGKVVRKISTSNQKRFASGISMKHSTVFPEIIHTPPPLWQFCLVWILPCPPPPPPKKTNSAWYFAFKFLALEVPHPLGFPMTFHWVGMDFFLKLHNKQNVYLSFSSLSCLTPWLGLMFGNPRRKHWLSQS